MNSLGVGDPLGAPAPLGRFLRGVPRPAWLFFGAAAIAVIARTATSPGPDLASDAQELAIVGVTGGLFIALPGIALIKRPSLGTSAPLAYRGLILIAVGTVMRLTLGFVFGTEDFLSGEGALDFDLAYPLILVGGSILAAVGWLALARALIRGDAPAGPRITAVAALAVAAIVGAAFADLVSTATVAADGAFTPRYVLIALIGLLAYGATSLAWAALAWAFIRALSSDRSIVASVAALWSVSIAIGAGLAFATSALVSSEVIESNLDLYNAIGIIPSILPPILLAVAVGLGLVQRAETDPSVRAAGTTGLMDADSAGG